MLNAVDANNHPVTDVPIDPDKEREIREERIELKLIEILDQHSTKFFASFQSKTISTLLFLLIATPLVVMTSQYVTTSRVGENRASAGYGTPEISLIPAETQIPPGKAFTVNIFVNTNEYNLSEAKVELRYNPKYLTITDAKAGNLLTEVAAKEINPESGQITLMLKAACTPQSCATFQGSGFLATLFVTSQNEEGKTMLQLVPSSALGRHTELIFSDENAPKDFTASSSAVTVVRE